MTPGPVKETSPVTGAGSPPDAPPAGGLSSAEARRRLAESGPNAMPDTSAQPLRRTLGKFSATGVIAMLLVCALYLHLPLADIVPLVLTAVLASIPVALPATFTLSAALGARALAGHGVLTRRRPRALSPTRSVSAVQSAAGMVLTEPGLGGIVAAVKEGRVTFQRRRMLGSRPSLWLVASSVADIAIAVILAVREIAMTPQPLAVLAAALAAAVVFAVVLDGLKIPVFATSGSRSTSCCFRSYEGSR